MSDGAPLSKVESQLRHMDPNIESDAEQFAAAKVLLMSALVGPNIVRIAKEAKVPRAKVRVFSERLRKSGVWRGGKVFADWFEENGGIAFFLDVGVATGLFERGATR